MSQKSLERPQQLQWETYTRQEIADFLGISIETLHKRILRGFGAEENKSMRLENAAHHTCLHDLVETGISMPVAFEAAKKAAPAVATFAAKYTSETSFMNLNRGRHITIVNSSVFVTDLPGDVAVATKAYFGRELPDKTTYITFDCSTAARMLLAGLPRPAIRETADAQ